MRDPQMLTAIALVTICGAALAGSAEGGTEPNPGSGQAASNASVSLDSDSADAAQNGTAVRTSAERLDRAVDDAGGAVASTRVARERPVMIPRATVSDVDRSDVPRSSWSWLTLGVMPLAAVLGVIATVYWAVRRWVPAARQMDPGVLRVVGRAGITPKHTVALLHVGRRFVLVGVSGDRMERLETIEDPQEVADLLAATQSSGVDRSPFLETLEEESSSYEGAVEALAEPTIDARPGGARATHQLGSLLRRLRRLQRS